MALNLKVLTAACRVCGRPLQNPASIARGVGPTCGGGFKSSIRRAHDKETLSMFDAEFDYKFRDEMLVIYDLNRGGKSVTNDMENVLRIIGLENPDKQITPNTIIIYLDSEKKFDGVKYNGLDRSVGFIPLRADTEHEARRKYTALLLKPYEEAQHGKDE